MTVLREASIICVGEALIDWVCLDRTLDLSEAQNFVKAPGGAAANVAVGLARLGCPVSFLGGFADDLFGRWLHSHLTALGVDLQLSPVFEQANTRQAYVLTDENGDRVLKGFTQTACADTLLRSSALNPDSLSGAAILYWGSVIQSDPDCAAALLNYVDQASPFTLKVYDPNYRAVLWPSPQQAKAAMAESFKRAHVVKLSDDEVRFLKGTGPYEAAARELMAEYDIPMLVVTLGEAGSWYLTAQASAHVPPLAVQAVEMTGAGDGFVAGLLRGLYSLMPDAADPVSLFENLQPDQLKYLLFEANAVGALATTKPGAMSSLPTWAELDAFLKASALKPV
ncbi:carbohydrate kinase [Vampirovibrio sp.]|uniref:carbohydrate kinase family protein n=1 Tax=Vampirovibrio sp. TaxID=2717857 RepID=UPI0035930412